MAGMGGHGAAPQSGAPTGKSKSYKPEERKKLGKAIKGWIKKSKSGGMGNEI